MPIRVRRSSISRVAISPRQWRRRASRFLTAKLSTRSATLGDSVAQHFWRAREPDADSVRQPVRADLVPEHEEEPRAEGRSASSNSRAATQTTAP